MSRQSTTSNTDRTSSDSVEVRIGRRRTTPFVVLPEWVVLAPMTTQAKSLYSALAAHVNQARGDGLVWPTLTAIAEMLGFAHRQALTRYVKELREIGAIDVFDERTRTGTQRIYAVHETPPEGYQGHESLAAFYADQKSAETDSTSGAPRDSLAKSRKRKGGRTLQSSGGRTRESSRGRTLQSALTRATQPDEGNQKVCNSVEGPHGVVHSSSGPSPEKRMDDDRQEHIRAALLKKLPTLDRNRLVAEYCRVWCGYVRANGVEWLRDEELFVWGPDRSVTMRDNHPIGKVIAKRIDDHIAQGWGLSGFDYAFYLDEVYRTADVWLEQQKASFQRAVAA